jgi:hypothetical protein
MMHAQVNGSQLKEYFGSEEVAFLKNFLDVHTEASQITMSAHQVALEAAAAGLEKLNMAPLLALHGPLSAPLRFQVYKVSELLSKHAAASAEQEERDDAEELKARLEKMYDGLSAFRLTYEKEEVAFFEFRIETLEADLVRMNNRVEQNVIFQNVYARLIAETTEMLQQEIRRISAVRLWVGQTLNMVTVRCCPSSFFRQAEP